MNKATLAIVALLSSSAFAANEGKITRMGFSSSNSIWGPAHSDIVQLEITGGYNAPNCHSQYAAIRKSEEHLISAALAAYISGKDVMVQISSSDTYYDGTRCIIKDIRITN